MNRTELSRPVLVSGPSAFGWETTCVLEPVRESGIHVKLPTGDTVPLSDMTLGVNRLLHFLTLRWKRFILRIPEHILGLIFNLGLDGVLITPRTFRLPYDGRAKIFWDAIRPALRPSGTLDWLTVPALLAVTTSPDRYIEIVPAKPGCRSFAFDINVGYPDLGEVTLRGVAGEAGQSEPTRGTGGLKPLPRWPECGGGRTARSPSRSRLIPTRPRRLCSRNFAGIACWICSARSWPCLRKGEELPDQS